MSGKSSTFLTPASIGPILGFLAVLIGALGAHALKETLTARGAVDSWNTAVLFHLFHAVAISALVWSTGDAKWRSRAGLITAFWALGTILFSGSIYGLSVGGPSLLGPVTPLGGLFLLAGWGLAVVSGSRLGSGKH